MAFTKEAANAVLSKVTPVLRAQSARIAALEAEKAVWVEKTAQAGMAEDIVDMMAKRGVKTEGSSRKEKVAQLIGSGRDLGVLKQALALRGADMSYTKTAAAQVEDGEDASSDLEIYLLG